MIRKKKVNIGSFSFWQHYHKIIDLSTEGNEEILDRAKKYGKDEIEKRFYVLANVPEKYFDFEFDKIKKKITQLEKNENEIKKIEKYISSLGNAAQKGIGLCLSGPHGVAKTTIAIIILKKSIALNYRCFFWKSSEVVDFIRSGWKNESRRIFFDYIINNVDFLVIDDIARLFENSGSQTEKAERLYIDQIFTKRDDKNLSTIITSIRDLEQNKDIFGEALFSNFKERLIEIKLVGSDYRETIGENLINALD